MAFQFLCPQGHLLQGHESQAGQRCKCPYCSVEFIVPRPAGMPAPTPDQPQPDSEGGHVGGDDDYDGAAGEVHEEYDDDIPMIHTGVGTADPNEIAAALPASEQSPILHVLCPSGHQLETPREMLGEDAMCPYCQTIFRLRFEDSIEYRQRLEEERELREQKLGQTWMNWAIAIAVVVILGVITLIVVATAE
jgi:hypothetical protein